MEKGSNPHIEAIESQIKDLNDKIGALIAKVDAMPSISSAEIAIAKILVSSSRIPVVQEAIGKGLLRWATAEGSQLWDLVHWQSLLDSSKHNTYGGGFNIQAAIIGHPTNHGVDITIPTNVDDEEFSKIRNSQDNNDIVG